jgi:hypothetical protein
VEGLALCPQCEHGQGSSLALPRTLQHLHMRFTLSSGERAILAL